MREPTLIENLGRGDILRSWLPYNGDIHEIRWAVSHAYWDPMNEEITLVLFNIWDGTRRNVTYPEGTTLR